MLRFQKLCFLLGTAISLSAAERRIEGLDALGDSFDEPRLFPPKKLGLTIHEFSEVIFSEAENEFGSNKLEEEEAKFLWDVASFFEWRRAKQVEHDALADRRLEANIFSKNASDSSSAIVPFIVCDPNTRKSGYSCKKDIESYFGGDLMAISNNENMTCFFVSTSASVAEKTPPSLIIHPVMPEMKLQQGVVEEITRSNSFPSRLYSMFCPDRSSSSEEAERFACEIIGSMRDERNERGRSLSADIFLRLKDTATLPIQESELTPTFLREHGRHLLWTSALISDHQCKDLFSKLDYTADLKGDSFTIDLPSIEQLSSFPNSTKCLQTLVAGLSVRPEICSVGIVPDMKAMNEEAQWVVQSGVQGQRPFFDSGLSGEGEIIAISDSGLDTENCYFWDVTGDIVKDGSVDKSRRKVVQYVGYADDSDEDFGHGSHVVGTALGRKAENGRTESTGLGDGIARNAKVAFFDIGYGDSPYLRIPRSASQLLDPGRNAGARIHSASWGSDSNGYGYDERMYDEYLRDNDILFIVAAGNIGPGRNTVGSPATSKNGISVGASQNGGNHVTSRMRGKDYLAGFSSRGPTRDGRAKPDIVAPGAYIQSAAAGTSSCGSDGLYFLAGTSMATPVVSGTAALVRQYFKDGFYPSGRKNSADGRDPSGQLVKAVLLNGAQDLAGAQNGYFTRNVRSYDDNQNFGRVSLIDSLPLEGENTIRAKVVDRKSIRVEEVDRIVVEIDKSGGCEATELSVTLCWADPPSVPSCAQCLLNDLDLYVTKDGDSRTFFANGRDKRDTANNAERVRIPARDGDQFTIYVEATNLEESSQTYALVMTGCIADGQSKPDEPSPTFSPVAPDPTPALVQAPTPEPANGDDGESSPGDLVSISTTFTGQNYWYGNMFNVQAKENIVVFGMDIHTRSTDSVSVYVWTKPGSLVGSQYDSDKWTRIVSADVEGRGVGQATPIPTDAFTSGGVSIRAGETQAFYVTSDRRDLIMSEGTRFGREYKDDDNLLVDEGVASTYAFSSIYPPYVWNGRIDYLRDANSIATTLNYGTVYYGNMFNVEATESSGIIVTDLEIHTSATDSVYMEVWTRPGTYQGYETDLDEWTRIASGYVLGRGKGARTPAPPDIFDREVLIPAGVTQAFYVMLGSEQLLYSFGGTGYSNGDLIVHSGNAIGPNGDTYSPRIWNGVVRYRK